MNFWSWLRRKPKKLKTPIILSVQLCADHGLATVYWNQNGTLEPYISFVGPDGPFQIVGTPHLNITENQPVPLFYNYPNQTAAWVKVLGRVGERSVFSEPWVAYVELC